MLLCAEIFIEEFLKKEGLPYQVREEDDGNTVIVSAPWAGSDTSLIFSGPDGRDVSIISEIEDCVPEKNFETLYAVCNSLNASFKWLKFFVTKSGTVLAIDDAYLSEESVIDECLRLILPRMKIIEEAKPVVKRAAWA